MTNCQNNRVIKSHGIIFLDKREAILKVNQSNKNDVIEVLGEPHVKSISEKNTWIYIERRVTNSSLFSIGKEKVSSNNLLVLKINGRGVLYEM